MASRKKSTERNTFEHLVKRLSKTHPRLAAQLRLAHSNREERLRRYQRGARLKGYEELIEHLVQLEVLYKRNRKLRPIAFLIERARGDFETALEAALSGYHAVAHDAMRDVMEIEFLLREFRYEPHHINQWLKCGPKERNDRFRPALLRQRHAKRIGKAPEDVGEAADYKAHSTYLHVSPYRNPFGGPGLIQGNAPFADDSCFWEIMEQARRLLFAAHKLRRVVAPHLRGVIGPERGLKQFRDAWQRTQEMQAIFLALLQATTENETAGPDGS